LLPTGVNSVDDGDVCLQRLLDHRDDSIAVVGLDHERLVATGRNRVLDLRDLGLRIEVRIEELRRDVIRLRRLLHSGPCRLGERIRRGEAEEGDRLDLALLCRRGAGARAGGDR